MRMLLLLAKTRTAQQRSLLPSYCFLGLLKWVLGRLQSMLLKSQALNWSHTTFQKDSSTLQNLNNSTNVIWSLFHITQI